MEQYLFTMNSTVQQTEQWSIWAHAVQHTQYWTSPLAQGPLEVFGWLLNTVKRQITKEDMSVQRHIRYTHRA